MALSESLPDASTLHHLHLAPDKYERQHHFLLQIHPVVFIVTGQECIRVVAEEGGGRRKIVPSAKSVAGASSCNSTDQLLDPILTDKLFVVGGHYHSGDLKSTEVFDVNKPHVRCYHNQFFNLPFIRVHATGGAISDSKDGGEPRAVICGGFGEFVMPFNDCFRLGDPTPFTSISHPKSGVSSTVINDGKVLWVSGSALSNARFVSLPVENAL